MNYLILKARSLDELERLVDKRVFDGYYPTGGVFKEDKFDGFHGVDLSNYCQAVYTFDEDVAEAK